MRVLSILLAMVSNHHHTLGLSYEVCSSFTRYLWLTFNHIFSSSFDYVTVQAAGATLDLGRATEGGWKDKMQLMHLFQHASDIRCTCVYSTLFPCLLLLAVEGESVPTLFHTWIECNAG